MVKVRIPCIVRDYFSGYETTSHQDFSLSVYEAETLLRSIQAQLPGVKKQIIEDTATRISALERELKSLKGGTR